jgi:phosphate acetyltransferase/phosphate butyryltransferase
MTTTTASQPDNLGTLRNRTFDEIAVGDTESIERTLTARDIQLYAILSGDENPQHLDAQFAASTRFHGVIAHGMWAGALISALIGTRLPGPGSIYLGQTLKFRAPVRMGMTLDDAANADDAPLISAPDSKVVVAVERTNEEWIAAVHGLGAIAAA